VAKVSVRENALYLVFDRALASTGVAHGGATLRTLLLTGARPVTASWSNTRRGGRGAYGGLTSRRHATSDDGFHTI
jgi:hypothetical protein